MFQALPMSILQFINNETKEGGWDIQDILTFTTSIYTVFIFSISLVLYLFKSDTELLYTYYGRFKWWADKAKKKKNEIERSETKKEKDS